MVPLVWRLACWGLRSSAGDKQKVLVPGPHCPVKLCLSQEGDTALHDATRLSRYKIIKTLILHGADMMAKNEVSVWGQHRGHFLPPCCTTLCPASLCPLLQAGKTPTDLVQQWQVDTRQALETKELPQGEMEVPA